MRRATVNAIHRRGVALRRVDPVGICRPPPGRCPAGTSRARERGRRCRVGGHRAPEGARGPVLGCSLSAGGEARPSPCLSRTSPAAPARPTGAGPRAVPSGWRHPVAGGSQAGDRSARAGSARASRATASTESARKRAERSVPAATDEPDATPDSGRGGGRRLLRRSRTRARSRSRGGRIAPLLLVALLSLVAGLGLRRAGAEPGHRTPTARLGHQRQQLVQRAAAWPPPPGRAARRPVAHAAARLGHEQPARGPVPRLQAALVVAVEAAGSQPGEVERGRAGAPDVARPGGARRATLGLGRAAPRPRSRSRWPPAPCSSWSQSPTSIGSPLSRAPPPRGALKVSPRQGSCTTPTAMPSSSSSATLTHQAGKP